MKLIECIVRPGKLEEIIQALLPVTSGMTAREIRSCGPDGTLHAVYRGVDYETLMPGILLNIAADDSWVDEIIGIIAATARTGQKGDGSIRVLPIEESYHVRTGFMDI